MLRSKTINFKPNQLNFPVKPIYYGLLLLGIVLRLIPYLSNRSLWLDESWLSLNLIDRDFSGLLQRLDNNQVVPPLFLIIEKATIILFGDSEYALRLFPLIAGILCLPLVYRFTKAISGNSVAALLALLLFATYPLIINYCTEVRQYESDVFATLCLLTLVFDTSFSTKENIRYILLAVVGSVLIFLSNIVVLELFAIGVYYLFKYRLSIFRKPWLLAQFACWAIAFALDYHYFIYANPEQDFMLKYWQDYFMPFQIFSAGYWVWMYERFNGGFQFYPFPLLVVFILCVIIFIVKKQWLFLYLLLFALVLHFIISGFKMYPFETRHVLYLNAFIIPPIAIGFVEMVKAVKTRFTKYVFAILIMGLIYSINRQLENTQYPLGRIIYIPEEIKKSISFIDSNKSDGQKVYIYFAAKPALTYYLKTNRVPFKDDLIWGTEDWLYLNPETCFNDVSKLNGEVWLLFSHVSPFYPEHMGDEAYTLKRLTESHDSVLKTFKTIGSAAYLVKIK